MAVEQVEGIPVTVSQANEIDYTARDLRRNDPLLSEADSIDVACDVFICGHKPDVGPVGQIWSTLSLEDDPEEQKAAEERGT